MSQGKSERESETIEYSDLGTYVNFTLFAVLSGSWILWNGEAQR
jgi:hypothetical protein